MPAELDMTLPAPYGTAVTLVEEAFAKPRGRAVLEYAALRGRYDALVTMLVLRQLLDLPDGEHKVYAILAPATQAMRFFLVDWLEKAGVQLRRKFGTGPAKCVELPSGPHLWLLEPKDAESFPRGSIDALVCFDCHALKLAEVSFFRSINRGPLVMAGRLPDREHWFYKKARQGKWPKARLDAVATIAAFPDQARFLKEERKRLDDTTFIRTMELRDVVNLGGVVFPRFARERLWLRSDKDRRFLTAEQDAIARKQEGTPLVPFEPSRIQKRYLAAKRIAKMQGKPARFILLKYRRGGFTSIEQGSSYQLVATKPRSAVATLAHTLESTARIFTMVNTFHENDPRAPRLKGVGNAKRLEFADNGSVFFIGTAGSAGFARGDTLQRVHGSEVAFWCEGPNQFTNVQKLVAGLTEAASNGEVVLESTPNGVEWFAATYKEAKQGLNNFTPIFIPWFADPANVAPAGSFNEKEIQETLSDREKELVEVYNLSWSQIAFRRNKLKENRQLFAQEYPEDDVTCFLVSGTPYFDPELVQKRLAALAARPAIRKQHVTGGTYCEVRPPEKGKTYVIGGDTSEGIPGCDPSGLGVMESKTGEQVAWLHGLFKPKELGKHANLLSKKYNNALVGIERNNHGHAVLQACEEAGMRDSTLGGTLFFFQKERAGWSTDATTRPVLLSMLSQALEDRETGWNDPLMLEEMTTFRKQSDGQWRADPNCHDDTIFKWGIAEQMRNVPRHRTHVNEF